MSTAEKPTFDIDDVSFHTGAPDDLNGLEYRALYTLATNAYMQAFREQEPPTTLPDLWEDKGGPFADLQIDQVAHMLGGNLQGFEASRRDFNLLNQRPDFNEQSFHAPEIVIARQNEATIGYGLAANATSGSSPLERWTKMRIPAKRWAWLREVVVDPSAPNGVGLAIGHILLGSFSDRQPASAYTWEDHKPGAQFIESMGLTRDPNEAPQPVESFGPHRGPVNLLRWTGNVGAALRHIDSKPGAAEALKRAESRTTRIKD